MGNDSVHRLPQYSHIAASTSTDFRTGFTTGPGSWSHAAQFRPRKLHGKDSLPLHIRVRCGRWTEWPLGVTDGRGTVRRIGITEAIGGMAHRVVRAFSFLHVRWICQDSAGSSWLRQWTVPKPQTRSTAWIPTTRRSGNSSPRIPRAVRSLASLKVGTSTASLPM